jgi:hypothetical protein
MNSGKTGLPDFQKNTKNRIMAWKIRITEMWKTPWKM